MKAIFLVEVVNNNFKLPPLIDPDGGLQLQWDDNGTWRGGWSAIGLVPQMDTALVLVESSEATIDAMDDDDQWEFVELIEDPTRGITSEKEKEDKVKKIKVEKVKKYLKDHGHKQKDIDDQVWNTDQTNGRKALCILNKVTDEEYIRAGGTL